ncbi:MAG: response regulator transcription factor [Actinobacteria bacterium]|nr:response regulator transcription factor [Actinomycetota bacterium]
MHPEQAEAAESQSARAHVALRSPDVVLLDIFLPGASGLDGLRTLRQEFPSVPVVMLTMSDDPEYVEEAVRSGAVGYLVKNAPRDEVIKAVRAAAEGGAYIQAEVTRPLLVRFAREARSARTDGPTLSPRERDVIALVAQGAANKQIGVRLSISEATVKSYLQNVFEKLGAADRAQAVAIALRARLID